MLGQHQLTNAEAAEAAAVLRKPRADKPWQTRHHRQTSSSFDTTEHTVSSTHEDSSHTCFSEELKLHAVPMIPVNVGRGSEPKGRATFSGRNIASVSRASVSPTKSRNSMPSTSTWSSTTPFNISSAGSLESRIMKRYKMSYKEALEVTSKARRESSKRYISVEEICHEIIKGVESDFRTVKLRPVNQQPKENKMKASSPKYTFEDRAKAVKRELTPKEDDAKITVPKITAPKLSCPFPKQSRSEFAAEVCVEKTATPKLSGAAQKPPRKEFQTEGCETKCAAPKIPNPAQESPRREVVAEGGAVKTAAPEIPSPAQESPRKEVAAEGCEVKTAAPKVPDSSKMHLTSGSIFVGSPSFSTFSAEGDTLIKIGNISGTSGLLSVEAHTATSLNSSAGVRKEKHVSFNFGEEEGLPSRRISTTNQLPQSFLMHQFNLSFEEATSVAEKARFNIGTPTWIPTGPEILEECTRLAIDRIRPKTGRKGGLTLPAVQEDEAKVQLEAQPHIGKQSEETLKNEASATGKLDEIAMEKLKSKTGVAREVDQTTTEELKNETKAGEEFVEDVFQNTTEDLRNEASATRVETVVQTTTEDNKTLTQSLLYADHLSRPLETILAQRHDISWNKAQQIVQKGRRLLDMAHTHAWSAELERLCEEKCLALNGNRMNTSGEKESLSVVYSVDVKDLSESETEIGKSWVSYSIEECSLVSRCPSRNQGVIYIERESASFYSAASTQSLTSEAFDIPCVIYIRINDPPEVPVDEPLDAILGIPFLHRRRSKRSQQRPKRDGSTTIFQRLLAKVKSSVTGRLSSNNSECQKITLVDL